MLGSVLSTVQRVKNPTSRLEEVHQRGQIGVTGTPTPGTVEDVQSRGSLKGDVAALVGAGGVGNRDVHGYDCRPLRGCAQGPTGVKGQRVKDSRHFGSQ